MAASLVHLVIPVRTASQRIPEKIFADIQGKPLIVHMAEHAEALQKRCKNVCAHMAVDSEKAAQLLETYKNLQIHMTDPALPSGTDRVNAVLKKVKEPCSWVVNVQGDMPFISRKGLADFIEKLAKVPERFGMATLAEPFDSVEAYKTTSVVKVLVGDNSQSVYFSRHPIPYGREPLPQNPADLVGLSHIGVYAYRPQILKELSKLPPHPIEKAEGLEQLRALAAQIEIYLVKTRPEAGASYRGIDVADDLSWARSFSHSVGKDKT